MERLQNPFSVYDFLGYLIPGAFCIYSFLILFAPAQVSWSTIFEFYRLDDPVMIFPFTIASYISGHLISFLSSISIEKYAIWAIGYPSKYLLGIESKGYWESIKRKSDNSIEKFVRFLSRFILVVFLFPIYLFDNVFGKHCFARYLYARKLDSFTKDVIVSKLDEQFESLTGINDPNKSGDIIDQNFFIVVYHYCLERVQNHQNKYQNYVALYGFLRALSLLFVIIFWSMLVASLLNLGSFSFLLIFFLGLLSFISFMGYSKFTRRFTVEVLMSYVSITESGNVTLDEDSDEENHDGGSKRFSNWVSSAQ